MPRVLGEIFHGERPISSGRAIERTAVRGVIRHGDQLLMLYSPVNQDYKFPGGGMELAESPEDALRRELREECGCHVTTVGEVLGDIIEYSPAVEDVTAVFRMTSRYIACQVDEQWLPQRLEQYERELGLRREWVDIRTALDTNLLADGEGHGGPWLRRETLMLRLLLDGTIGGRGSATPC